MPTDIKTGNINAIEKAILEGRHFSVHDELEKATWDDFRAVSGGGIYLMGVGGGLDYYIKNYERTYSVKGFIDNNSDFCGYKAGEVLASSFDTSLENVHIYTPDLLTSTNQTDVPVLITSTKYYNEMYDQLKSLGVKHCFSLLCMEAKNESRPADDCIYDERYYAEKYSCLEADRDKILFCPGAYGDHSRVVLKRLLESNYTLNIVWIVNDLSENAPLGVHKVLRANWKKVIYEWETSSVWCMEELNVPKYIIKRESQTYIQLKHWSSITLKKFYFEDLAITSDTYAYDVTKRNSEMMDYVFSGSDFDEQACKTGFRFDGPYVRVGSPRSDALFDYSIKEKIHQDYSIHCDTRIALYVPTFRENPAFNNILFQYESSFQSWNQFIERRFRGEWCIMLKLHPVTVERMKRRYTPHGIIDASVGSECLELLSAADVVITDYSSAMFEPAFVKKPVFLFAPDRDEYIGGERELLLDYDSLPFPIAETNEQLAENILNFDQEKYEADVTAFLDKYGVHEDGHASERAAEFILGLMG